MSTRSLTLKEAAEAVPRDNILHEILAQFSPFRLSELQHVLTLREIHLDTDDGRVRLISDDDLEICYFERNWGFRKDGFVLADWRELSFEQMKAKVTHAHPRIGGRRVYPPGKVHVDTLETKEEIVRAFSELTYVPAQVYAIAVAGAHVLRSVRAGDVGEDRRVVNSYLRWACRAGLDASVIRQLATTGYIDQTAWAVAAIRHTDVVDLLASEFGARIGANSLTDAAQMGHNAMIDHLVENYGVDSNEVDRDGWTALHWAARCGFVHTVKHLVEKHHVGIHKTRRSGKTALDCAEEHGRTECAAVLRGYGATNGTRFVDSDDGSFWGDDVYSDDDASDSSMEISGDDSDDDASDSMEA
jgi:hypothetical protein